MSISIFDLFTIGIGPSSSHTVGPMRAARLFALELQAASLLDPTHTVKVELFGSLGLTGRGHASDKAVILGLEGETPEQVEVEQVEARLADIRGQARLSLLGLRPIPFHEPEHLILHHQKSLSLHPNGMRFSARGAQGQELFSRGYYSIGGGFVIGEGEEMKPVKTAPDIPYPFQHATDLLRMGREYQRPIHELILENEKCWRSETEVQARMEQLWQVMQACVERGLQSEGVLPGGLNVRRRAPRLARKLAEPGNSDPLAAMDWVNVFAMAVNEENAAGGRVVTAPTNGAAGIIPAVLHYYWRFTSNPSADGVARFLLTAGAIGILYKKNASISGAEVGCQGEVGVACSMAAGGLVAAIGGNNEQVENAAEIGMEHNLGMTCDPIGGLVQIPCIERNALGAVKAINAARMAMNGDGGQKVTLDQVIRTMYQTGLDMQSRYKETSQGGLAVNVVEC